MLYNEHMYILYNDPLVLADQQKLIYTSSVWTQDVIWKNCLE